MPAPGYLILVFLGLLGLWNGAYASRPDPIDDKLSDALTSSLVAGLLAGIITAAFSLIYTTLLAHNIDPRAYLAMVSPESMKLFLFNLPGAGAFFIHLVLLTATGVLGGLLAFSLRKARPGRKLVSGWKKLYTNFSSHPLVTRIRSMPYAIYILYALLAVVIFVLPAPVGFLLELYHRHSRYLYYPGAG